MPNFEGTIEEFTKFIGGYSRNKVQSITSKTKKKITGCQECGSISTLDSAHIAGMERPKIIFDILSPFMEGDTIKVDLKEFEEKFIAAHSPIEKIFKFLCKSCHTKYDNAHKIDPTEDRYINGTEYDMEEAYNNELEAIKIIKNESSLSKRSSIELVEKNNPNISLRGENTIFSNLNSSVDVWWLEPANNKFKFDLYLLLNNKDERSLFLFLIPANTISDLNSTFEQRIDKEASKITIPKSNSKFIDKKNGYDLTKYLMYNTTY